MATIQIGDTVGYTAPHGTRTTGKVLDIYPATRPALGDRTAYLIDHGRDGFWTSAVAALR